MDDIDDAVPALVARALAAVAQARQLTAEAEAQRRAGTTHAGRNDEGGVDAGPPGVDDDEMEFSTRSASLNSLRARLAALEASEARADADAARGRLVALRRDQLSLRAGQASEREIDREREMGVRGEWRGRAERCSERGAVSRGARLGSADRGPHPTRPPPRSQVTALRALVLRAAGDDPASAPSPRHGEDGDDAADARRRVDAAAAGPSAPTPTPTPGHRAALYRAGRVLDACLVDLVAAERLLTTARRADAAADAAAGLRRALRAASREGGGGGGGAPARGGGGGGASP